MNVISFHKQLELLVEEAKKMQKEIGTNPGGRDIAMTVTKLEEAHMWFEKGFPLESWVL